jgi:hypothetical protein
MNVRDERPLIGYLLRSYRKRQLRMFALVGAGAGRPLLIRICPPGARSSRRDGRLAGFGAVWTVGGRLRHCLGWR